jgi:hypothetical protein
MSKFAPRELSENAVVLMVLAEMADNENGNPAGKLQAKKLLTDE